MMVMDKVPVEYFRYSKSDLQEIGKFEDYVCKHGYDSRTCGVDNVCNDEGERMRQWYDGLGDSTKNLLSFWSGCIEAGMDTNYL